ncbi:MAG: DeoR family transcriptional regulator [Spirochaetales bacterium]|nr:MAG: DeoR family transcriptional regulator [Spirochaetales bacterium]
MTNMKLPDNRLEKILFLLKKRGSLSTKEFSRIFHVSEVTIRNDLNELSRQGLVIRSYGGATIAEATSVKRLSIKSAFAGSSSAELIGEEAAKLVNDGDVIFLDSTPCAKALAEHLGEREHLTVFTNSIPLASRLTALGQLTVYLTGGKVNNETAVVSGGNLDGFLDKHHITKAFVSCWGMTEEQGLTDARVEEAEVKKTFISKARQVIGMVESSRWGVVSLVSFAAIKDLDIIVTDDGADDAMLEGITRANVRIQKTVQAVKINAFHNSPYEYYDTLRTDAEGEKTYTGQPGRGKKIAFANGLASEPFCIDVERSFYRNAKLAGFSPENIYVFDNEYDERKALINAEAVIKLKPDIFVEFQLSAKMNNIIAAKMDMNHIPILALETPIPAAPFVGVNNWQAGIMAGDFAADEIRKKMGGISAIDKIILIQLSIGSEINLFRTEGFAASLAAAFGEEVEEKVIREDCLSNTAEAARESMARALSKCGECGHLTVTTINHEAMSGVISALKRAGMWAPGRHILVSHSCDEIGRAQIEEDSIDGSIGYFPERYGRYILPAACALLSNKAVPPYTYVDTRIITKETLHAFYPDRIDE